MPKSFMAACSQVFGKKEGQSLQDFKKEIDALTDKDRADLAPLLSAACGEEVTASRGTPTS